MSIIGVLAPAKGGGWIAPLLIRSGEGSPHSLRQAQHRQRTRFACSSAGPAWRRVVRTLEPQQSNGGCARPARSPNLLEPLDKRLCYSDMTMALERCLCSRALERGQSMIVRRRSTRDA
jgi:hypothetical protein